MANNNWRTPPEIFNHFHERYNFVCDVCASKENALCVRFITEKVDYLLLDPLFFAQSGKYVWQNPPYSNPLPFVKKAIEDSRFHGIGCVILLNHDMSTQWAKLLTDIESKHFVITDGRVSFLNEEGLPIRGNTKGQFLVDIPPYCKPGKPVVEYLPLSTFFKEAA